MIINDLRGHGKCCQRKMYTEQESEILKDWTGLTRYKCPKCGYWHFRKIKDTNKTTNKSNNNN